MCIHTHLYTYIHVCVCVCVCVQVRVHVCDGTSQRSFHDHLSISTASLPTQRPFISNKGQHSSKTSRQRLLGSKIKAVWHLQTVFASDQPFISVCKIFFMQQSSCFNQSREDQKICDPVHHHVTPQCERQTKHSSSCPHLCWCSYQ